MGPLKRLVELYMQHMEKNKIILVEDDIFLADLLSQKLKKEGFSFDHATTGEEALEKASSLKPALIILDLVLPGIDGYEVLEKLKANKELASIPVIILSNLGQKYEIERGLNMGAADFLVKANLDLDQIMDKIKQFIKVE